MSAKSGLSSNILNILSLKEFISFIFSIFFFTALIFSGFGGCGLPF